MSRRQRTAARLTALRDGLAIDRTLYHEDLPAHVLMTQLSESIQYNLGLSSEEYAARQLTERRHDRSLTTPHSPRSGSALMPERRSWSGS